MSNSGITVESYARRNWDGRPERVLSLTAFDSDTGRCVTVQLDNSGVARLRRSIQALDKKAEKIVAAVAKEKKREAEKRARAKAKRAQKTDND